MTKFIFTIIFILFLLGCDDKVRTEKYWLSHKKEAKKYREDVCIEEGAHGTNPLSKNKSINCSRLWGQNL